jgi:hypothetical protein
VGGSFHGQALSHCPLPLFQADVGSVRAEHRAARKQLR